MLCAHLIKTTKVLFISTVWLAIAQTLFAQQVMPLTSGLSVTVSHEAKLAPKKVRLLLPVRVESRESETVLKTLKGHQEAVKKQLVAFGVPAESIEFSEPNITASVPGVENPEAARKAVRQQAIQTRNMNPQMRAQFPIPAVDAIDDFDLPIVYAAECNLTVDWKLDNGLDEKALLLPSRVKMLMDEKGFSGKQFREVLSAEEEKLIEPLMGNNSYYVQNTLMNYQRLFFVGEMSEDIEKAAIAAAAKKGRAEATLMAESAGLKLGKLRSIQKSTPMDALIQQQAIAVQYMQYGANVPPTKEKNDREVANVAPNALRRIVSVNMVFDFE
jgi:uncharacterized protein YggE